MACSSIGWPPWRHYFQRDPNTCLFKLRQFTELLAQDVAARASLLTFGGQAGLGLR
jgi:hypothetical protein